MALTYAPCPVFLGLDNNGNPIAGGKLFTYAAGTLTALATYSDSAGAVANANPLILDAAGRGTVFLSPSSYKFILKDASDVTIWTRDNIGAVPPTAVDLDVEGVAGESLAALSVVYLSDGSGGTVAGRWNKTDADLVASSTTAGVLGVVTATFGTGATGTIRLQGKIAGFAGLTAGADYYLSGTAGDITTTPPLNKRYVGRADSTTTLIIAPGEAPTTTGASRGIYHAGTTPGGTIGGGITAYLGSRGRSAVETSAIDVSSVVCTIKNLYVRFDGPPGAGQSFTVTVRKNLAATAVTCIVSDANINNQNILNTVTLAPGDNFDVQVVASATAATRECAVSFEMTY